jgi:hypothetical protein
MLSLLFYSVFWDYVVFTPDWVNRFITLFAWAMVMGFGARILLGVVGFAFGVSAW